MMDGLGDDGDAQVRFGIGQAVRELLRLAPPVHAELAARVGVGTTDLLALDHATSGSAPLGVVELGKRLGIRSASATVLVHRLVAAGHLQRSADPRDRRRTSLEPTQSAHQDVRAALDPLIRDITDITNALDADTAVAVLQFLTQIGAALRSFAGTGPGTAAEGNARDGGRAARDGGRAEVPKR